MNEPIMNGVFRDPLNIHDETFHATYLLPATYFSSYQVIKLNNLLLPVDFFV